MLFADKSTCIYSSNCIWYSMYAHYSSHSFSVCIYSYSLSHCASQSKSFEIFELIFKVHVFVGQTLSTP